MKSHFTFIKDIPYAKEFIDNYDVMRNEAIAASKVRSTDFYRSQEQYDVEYLNSDVITDMEGWFGNWTRKDGYESGRDLEAFPLILAGHVNMNNAKYAPVTCRIVGNLQEEYMRHGKEINIFMAGFSRLSAGKKIYEHVDTVGGSDYGMISLNYCLVNGDEGCCSLRVEDETVVHEDGKGFIFDGSKLHEASNNGTKDRIIFYMSMSHVCL